MVTADTRRATHAMNFGAESNESVDEEKHNGDYGNRKENMKFLSETFDSERYCDICILLVQRYNHSINKMTYR